MIVVSKTTKKWLSVLLVAGLLCALFTFGAAAGTRGDVDKNGAVESADARLALRRSVRLEDYMPGSGQFIAADMDGDGAVSSGDARAVLRLSVGLPTGIDETEPVEKAPDEAFHNAMLRFALALFRQTAKEDGGKNLLVSPLSVTTALAMAANGAKGETLAQLEDVLGNGLSVADLNAYLRALTQTLPNSENSRLHVANSVWINNSVREAVQRPFLRNMLTYYGAGINACDFDQAGIDAVNNWVKENTEGMIDSILKDPDPNILMALLNALAFDAKWQRQFDPNAVRTVPFTRENGVKEDCEMMRGEERLYLEDDTTTGFVKAYSGDGYRFAALLPKEGIAMKDYIASLTPEKLSALFANAQTGTVQIGLPKFRFDYGVTLNDALKAMGADQLFNPAACDLSGMFPAEIGAHVSQVLHKTFIEVDTEGTRAAAVTAVIVSKNAMQPLDSKTVILDRPFVFLITMGEADTPVFIGAVKGCR